MAMAMPGVHAAQQLALLSIAVVICSALSIHMPRGPARANPAADRSPQIFSSSETQPSCRSAVDAAARDSSGHILLHVSDPSQLVVVSSGDPTGGHHEFEVTATDQNCQFGRKAGEGTATPGTPDRSIPTQHKFVYARSESVWPAGQSSSESRGGEVAGPDSRRAAARHVPDPVRRFLVPKFHGEQCVDQPELAELLSCCGRIAVYGTTGGAAPEGLRMARQLVWELENGLVRAVEKVLCPLADVDDNGRLTILLCDMNGPPGVPGSAAMMQPVRGCVRAADWGIAATDFAGDIIYIDRSHVCSDSLPLRELLVHELSHAAVCSESRRRGVSLAAAGGEPAAIPAWLNEGIAHAMERRLAPGCSNLETRMTEFLRDPAGCPVVPGALTTALASRRTGTRAAATLFVEMLVDQGTPLRVLGCLQSDAILRIEHMTGQPWGSLIHTWAQDVANHFAGSNGLVSTPRLAIRTLKPDLTCRVNIRGSAMCCLRPQVVPCQIRLIPSANARLSAVVLTPQR